MYKIEDEAHDESFGEFEDREEAIIELRRLSTLPWDEPPTVPPCTNWRDCGRRYELVEFEVDGTFQRELSRTPAVEVSAKGAKWAEGFR